VDPITSGRLMPGSPPGAGTPLPAASGPLVRPHVDHGVYGISVAAELAGTGVQALRLYERRGLLEPDRTEGGTRRYSEADLIRARRIGDLLGAGLNLCGIAMVLGLETENAALRARLGEPGRVGEGRDVTT
jgi:MerR family transcriptional regulator/heat shock protein HspR